MPTPEQLRSFVTDVDGATSPDFIPLGFKIRIVLSDYHSQERLGAVFTGHDNEVINAFRAEILAADQADASVMDEMYRDLCGRVDELDGESLAREVDRMDKVIAERRDARARALLQSLSPEGANAVSSEAERVGREIKGANSDLVAMAHQYPDFVKERVKQRCTSLGFARSSVR